MNKIAVYAGSFDPITTGHENIIHRAVPLFDKFIIAIGRNASKKGVLFDIQERIDLIKHACGPLISAREIEVTSFDGLLVNFCRDRGANIIVRGLRAAMDFEYELTIALANKTQASDIETVFLPAEPNVSFVSSSIIKEIASHGGNVRAFCSPYVEQKLWAKFGYGGKSGQAEPTR
jgi:pantetheine-phosphate adenylyltransferase